MHVRVCFLFGLSVLFVLAPLLRAENEPIYNMELKERMKEILATYQMEEGDRYWIDLTDTWAKKSERASGYAEYRFTSPVDLQRDRDFIVIAGHVSDTFYQRFCKVKEADLVPGAKQYVPQIRKIPEASKPLNPKWDSLTTGGKLLHLEVHVTPINKREFTVYLQYAQREMPGVLRK